MLVITDEDVYSRRFWMLFLAVSSILVNVAQITEYTSIEKTVVNYYEISDATVSLSGTSYLLFYLISLYPGTIYVTKCGLRHSLIIGSFLNAIGLCVKCFVLKPGRFWLAIVAQIFPAIGETLIAPSIPALAATWFKSNEVATVLALSSAASHCGLGFTFLFQGTLFQEESDVQHGLNVHAMSLVVFAVVVFLLTVFTMEDKPPKPPSAAQAQKQSGHNDYQLRDFLSDFNFICISLVSGVVSSAEFIVALLVNQLILTAFPNGDTDVAINGITLAVAYVIGSLVFGTLLDRTKKFKQLSIITTLLTIVSTVLIGAALACLNKVLLIIGTLLFGLFSGASASVTMDSTIELTFPFPETISISFIYCLYCAIPLILTPVCAFLINIIGPANTVFIIAALMVPVASLLWRIKWTLKRKTAEEYKPLFIPQFTRE